MQKPQVKPKRDKKKNVETGLLMGQNTNIFSQLSASFLQAKALPSEQEEAFLKNTQIVEYHDQNINRLIALLRKKAEVTKVKAVLELREEIAKMNEDDVEEFMPTFAQLYLEIVLNEPSKQIVEEFVATLLDLLSVHKKTVVREMNTLYGPLLISVKLSKLVGVLFTGSEQQQYTKALVLLLKREVRKKFGVMFKIVMECDSKEKIGLTNYQRNCGALMRLVKDFVRIYERSEKAKELQGDFVSFIREVCESFSGECVDEYLKNGGKAKAAILQIYSSMIVLASRHGGWQIEWQRYAKVVGSNFLDKEPIVQQTLWRSCNQSWIEALLRMDEVNRQQKGEEVASLLHVYLPKCDQKLLACLRVGGLQMYRELPQFCSTFPWTTFLPADSHKLYVNKINFMRKLLTSVLQEEDENEARMECYCALANLFVTRVRTIELEQLQEKKAKEMRTLMGKLQKETVENLQEKYYSDPPVSKNSFTFHVPVAFARLINTLRVSFDFKFKPEGVFALYQFLQVCPENQATLDALYAHCKQNLQLTLRYLQMFPKRPIELDMSSSNKQTELTAKIFLLTSEPREGEWLREEWDLKKKIIAYDPRITQRDLQLEEDDETGERLEFKPTNRNFPSKLYDRPQMDGVRFSYFQQQLFDGQSTSLIKYLIPLVNDVLLPRNPSFVNRLLKHFSDRVSLLTAGKWLIGKHEVVVIRVLSRLIVDSLLREKEWSGLSEKLLEECMLGYCEFVRLMFNYKMEGEVDELLRRIGQLLPSERYRQLILASCQRSVKLAYSSLLRGTLQGQLEKVRKNRLKKCVELISKLLWYCLLNSDRHSRVVLFKQFIDDESNWKEAESRAQPWIVGSALLQGVESGVLAQIASHVVDHFGKYFHFISLVLSADTLLPLQAQHESRKLYIGLKEHIQKRVLVLSPQSMCSLLKGVLDSLFLQSSVNLSQGIKSLISYLLLQNEENSSQLLLTLQQSCLSYPFQRYVKESHNINRSLIFIAVISANPLKRLEDIDRLYIELVEKLNLSKDGLEYLEVVAICCVFWNKSIGIEDAMANDLGVYRGVLVKTLQSFEHPTASLSPMNRNFSLYSLFSFINAVVPHAGREILAPHETAIEQLFWSNIAQGSELHGLAQTMRMRYATRSVLTCKPESLRRLMIELPRIATAEFMFYKQLLVQIEQDGQEELPHYENIVTLFIEIAEFLIRITGYLSEERHPEESTVLQLIQCPFPALKKSAFILLKAMYELKVVPREPPKIYIELLAFEVGPTDELTSGLCSSISTYLYTWQALLLRRSATERPPANEEEITLSLEEYIQNQGYSDLLIKNCFVILDDKLQYLRNQSDFSLTAAQLIQTDYEIDFLQSSQLSQKMFKMAMQTLFLYIINFPIFLRGFMDRTKKYKNICERLLRNVICDAIFKEEVAKIEMHEEEWKAAGNFEIYVTAKNREIYAEYTHDVIRIGLRLVMRANYPLTPIAIQFGEGLKIEDGSRWGLMLQSQLHNRNNTIINGILLWKANIDKKLSGVQQCAICFDIVNPSGQLPKKACKTCRKKFHGNCIMRWFSKSNKSECPLCKSQFL